MQLYAPEQHVYDLWLLIYTTNYAVDSVDTYPPNKQLHNKAAMIPNKHSRRLD